MSLSLQQQTPQKSALNGGSFEFMTSKLSADEDRVGHLKAPEAAGKGTLS